MYCSNCGFKNDGNMFCVNCGNRLNNSSVSVNDNPVKNENNGFKTASIALGIIGIVVAFTMFFSPCSLIITIVGLILGINASKKVNNVVGIVLNSIGLFISIVMLIFFILVMVALIGEEKDYNDYYSDTYYDDFDNYYDRNYYGNKGEYY